MTQHGSNQAMNYASSRRSLYSFLVFLDFEGKLEVASV